MSDAPSDLLRGRLPPVSEPGPEALQRGRPQGFAGIGRAQAAADRDHLGAESGIQLPGGSRTPVVRHRRRGHRPAAARTHPTGPTAMTVTPSPPRATGSVAARSVGRAPASCPWMNQEDSSRARGPAASRWNQGCGGPAVQRGRSGRGVHGMSSLAFAADRMSSTPADRHSVTRTLENLRGVPHAEIIVFTKDADGPGATGLSTTPSACQSTSPTRNSVPCIPPPWQGSSTETPCG